MTTKQKAEAYDKVREKIALRFGSNVAEETFSEFEMSEDEKIRKEIMYHIQHCDDTIDKETEERMIAWLEKQGEKKSVNWNELTWEDINDLEAIINEVHSDFRNGIGQKSFGLEVLERFLYNKDGEDLDVKSPKFKDGDEIRSIDGQYEDTVLEVLSDGSYRLKNLGLLSIPENEWELVNAPVNGYELIEKKEQNTQKVLGQQLEKQGEHKGINDTDEDIVEAVKDTSILDMVEPKFKVGDWVVTSYGKVNQVVKVDEDVDGFTLDDDTYFSGSWKDGYHLWTIHDAKDGDVLVCNDNPFLFSKYERDEYGPVCCSYCGISNSDYGEFLINTNTKKYWCDIEFVNPATKEQRDLLFSKMKEAGYEFDFEKKELNKIEDEPENYKQRVMSEMTDLVKDYIREKPVEWSEEDEHKIKDIIYFLDTAKKHYASTVELDACIDWLKLLKDRVQPQTWEPTEEQAKWFFRGILGYYNFSSEGQKIMEEICKQLEQLKQL